MTTTRTPDELEARYDELSWLEGADPSNASDSEAAANHQYEVTSLFAAINDLVRDGNYLDPATGEYSREYLAYFEDAVTVLESLDGLFS